MASCCIEDKLSTVTNLKEITFKWTIKNFDMCTQLQGEYLRSPEFSIDALKASSFNLMLCPRDDYLRSGKYVSLFLERNEDLGPEKIMLNVKMCLLNSQGYWTNVMEFQEMEYTKKCCLGFRNFYERDLLFKQRNRFLPENNLTVECQLLPLSANERSDDDTESEVYNEEVCEILSAEFAEILNNGIHYDTTILVRDKKFHVHKAILECRCPKLIEQLEHTKVPNMYALSCVEETDLHALLRYIYTGTLSSTSMTNGVFNASQTYGFPDLYNAYPYPISILASTETKFTHLPFKWIVTGVSKLQENKEVVSTLFYDAHEQKRMEIILIIKQRKNETKDILLKFRRACTKMITFIRCKVTFGAPGKRNVKEFEHIFESKKDWVVCLCSSIKLSEIVCSDALDLFFEIQVSNGEQYSKIEEVFYDIISEKAGDEIIKNFKLLQKDFRILHSNPKFADITLCVDGQKLPAHKAILCARSKVFAKMFEHEMLEKQEGIIVIEDMDLPTISSMLLYIYCGCIKVMNISEAATLYTAADKYELLTLKEKCSIFLKSNLDEESIGEILLLADAHDDKNLLKCIYDFISSHLSELLQSEKFLSIMNSRLSVSVEVINALLERSSVQKGIILNRSSSV